MNEQNQYRKQWKERLEDFENSGLNIKNWCEKNQLKEHQFYYWRNKFKSKEASSTTLVPIDLTQIANQTNEDSRIKINIGTISLEIHHGFNPSQLKEIMKVLMEVC